MEELTHELITFDDGSQAIVSHTSGATVFAAPDGVQVVSSEEFQTDDVEALREKAATYYLEFDTLTKEVRVGNKRPARRN